ncbi:MULTISPECIES: hypothetical protein [Pseudomonas]
MPSPSVAATPVAGLAALGRGYKRGAVVH